MKELILGNWLSIEEEPATGLRIPTSLVLKSILFILGFNSINFFLLYLVVPTAVTVDNLFGLKLLIPLSKVSLFGELFTV
jgi:hypothetical protein